MAPKSVDDKPLYADLSERLNLLPEIKPVEYVPVNAAEPLAGHSLYKDKVIIYSIHGGDVIPKEFYNMLRRNYPSETRLKETLRQSYNVEKDWGANQVASELAYQLGIGGFWRVNIARALLDFGRLPGITPPDAGHLERYAINYPFSYYLDLDGKRALLERFFDPISETFEREVAGKVLTLGIHSYDHLNPVGHYTERGTLRPEASLIFRPESFQQHKRMPRGLFDPLYPDQLAESTADRRLTARLSLMLERAGIAVAHNHPYSLPDGSLETRSQVWDYFHFLKRSFEARYEETRLDEAYAVTWNMLLDTNLRSSSSEALRSYLHMFRTAPDGRKVLFRKAQRAYSHIQSFFDEDCEALLGSYRKNPNRQSSLAIEVRKDLVWHFHDKHTADPVLGPEGCLRDNVRHITELLARGIDTYFREDRTNKFKKVAWKVGETN